MKGRLEYSSEWSKLFLIAAFSLTGLVFFTALSIALTPLFFPVTVDDVFEVMSTPSELSAEITKFTQGFFTLGSMLIPSLILARLFSTDPQRFMGLSRFPQRPLVIIVLTVLLAVGATGISDVLYRLLETLYDNGVFGSLGEWLIGNQELMNQQLEMLLKMNNFAEFFEVFLIMAILPAVCEETLFRGLIQPIAGKALKNDHLGILLTSFFFALIHMQFLTFPSIFFLGMLLGYLRYWSGSLWLPVILHLVNNGAIVVLVYFFDMPVNDVNNADVFDPMQFVVLSSLFVVSLFGLWRLLRDENQFA